MMIKYKVYQANIIKLKAINANLNLINTDQKDIANVISQNNNTDTSLNNSIASGLTKMRLGDYALIKAFDLLLGMINNDELIDNRISKKYYSKLNENDKVIINMCSIILKLHSINLMKLDKFYDKNRIHRLSNKYFRMTRRCCNSIIETNNTINNKDKVYLEDKVFFAIESFCMPNSFDYDINNELNNNKNCLISTINNYYDNKIRSIPNKFNKEYTKKDLQNSIKKIKTETNEKEFPLISKSISLEIVNSLMDLMIYNRAVSITK